MIKKILNGKKRQPKKIFLIVFLGLFISFGVLTFITANESVMEEFIVEENIQGEFTEVVGELIVDEIIEEVIEEEPLDEINLCENVVCGDSEIECLDEIISSCPNICNLETGECSNCEVNCEDLILIENFTGENEILNETNFTFISNLGSGSNNLENGSGLEPELEIFILHEDKTTRGELIEFKAVITNYGGFAKNVLVNWNLPFEFEIVSENSIGSCGDLDLNESCISVVKGKIKNHSSLGENEMKLKVTYQNEI